MEDTINYFFATAGNEIRGNWLPYLYSSLRKYLEWQFGLRIVVAPHSKVPRGKAIAGLTKDHRRYIIFLNGQDVADAAEAEDRDLIRLRVGHELAHLACLHLAKQNYVIEQGLGHCAGRSSRYNEWRVETEDEADVFAYNLFLACGPVVERHIPAESDWQEKIGELTVSVQDGRESKKENSKLNSAELRSKIRKSLRQRKMINPPEAYLCQTLAKIESETAKFWESMPRRDVSSLLHSTYRKYLKQNEAKPNDENCNGCELCS